MPETPSLTGAEIAIVGMALRVPGARDVDAFWRNVRDGVCSISRFSREEAAEAGAPEQWLDDPAHVRAGGVLEGMAEFDAGFFGYSPREAELMDPQQRHFLELAWEAMEHAGYDPARVKGPVGVFAGAGVTSYLLGNLAANEELVASVGHFPLMIANDKDFLATRTAYKLDLRGPAVTVQTACSTSLVAVHMACQSLLNGECDMALAGGVAINVRQQAGYLFQEGGIGAPDGVCRAFDAEARGTVGGSGAGLVALKRLEDAIKDCDTIHAVIKGSAINNDGAGKVGYTAPSAEGQARAIAEALAIAGVDAADIGYVEAHGTGTAVGDPIEVAALTEAYRAFTDATGYCALGSVKTNLGHLDIAAGVVGLIKAALAVKHGQVPPSLHFERPHPAIDFASSPFVVNAALRDWPLAGPRRAGVSSFGIGGTNAHAVLESYEAAPTPATSPRVTLRLSARTPEALSAASARLAAHLADRRPALADVAHTLTEGRRAFEWRRAVVADSLDEAVQALSAPDAVEAGAAPVAFLFPGQGAQHPNMARGLYEGDAGFRADVDRCCEVLRAHLGRDLREALYPAPGRESEAAELLTRTELTQPALFVVSWALARALMARGVTPAAMLGHSVGEYVAACLAGVFTLEDALRLVATRGRLLQALPPGRMLAVAMTPEALESRLPDGCAIAAVNAPDRCVAAGPTEAIAALEAALVAEGVATRPLHTSHAFHSPMVAPAAEALAAAVAAVPRQAPTLAYVSNVTGRFVTASEATDPAQWARHLREPVRFADSLRTLADRPGLVLLEVGPGTSLSRLARPQLGASPVLATLGEPNGDDRRRFHEALGRLWAHGLRVTPEPMAGRRIPLPTYPFERRRYWIAPPKGDRTPTRRAAAVRDFFHAPTWRPLPRLAETPVAEGPWLVYAAPGAPLSAALRARGASVVEVHPGTDFALEGAVATLRPDRLDDHLALWAALARPPVRLVFAWDGEDEPDKLYGAFAHALVAAARLETPIEVCVVAPGLWRVDGADRVRPALAVLLGPARVAPLEMPNLSIKVLDPGASAPETWLAELGPHGAPEVALRHGRRWAPDWAATPLDRPDAPVFRQGGVYLLTGGLGALGLAIAEHLAPLGARLALVGRTPPPPREAWGTVDGPHAAIVRRLQAMEAQGAEVMVLQADVADEAAMAAAISEVRARFGPIHGVFHLAGVAGGALMRFRGAEDACRVLRPKVAGAAALVRALGGEALDFCLLASSVNAAVGTPGQADYAAANAYLESLVTAAPPGLNAMALAFGPWREAGMAARAELPGELRALKDEALRHGLSNRDGLAAIERALAAGLPVVMASPTPPAALTDQASAWRERLVASAPAVHARPGLKTAYEAPATELERAIAHIWEELLGVDRVGRHDHFFELGGHSLTAVALLARLETLAGRKLPVERLLSGGTVAALAAVLAGEEAAGPVLPTELVPLATGGTGTPLVLVHPSGGSVLCYAELVRALGDDRPVYGLQAPGLAGEPAMDDIPAIAHRYLAAVRTAVPEGPVHLGGWSLGGVIAFEMARQLAAEGRAPASVLVIDNLAPVPANKPAALPDAQLLAMFVEDLRAITGVALALPADLSEPEAALARALDAAGEALAPVGGPDELRRRFAVFRAHLRAAMAYAPDAYAGPVHLIAAGARGDGAPTLGWEQLCGRLVRSEVPGDHYTIMAGEGAIALADAIRAVERLAV